MKEMVKEDRALNYGADECCSIAESMIDEIHHIAIQEAAAITAGGRHKGSLKKRLLRQIRQARQIAMMG